MLKSPDALMYGSYSGHTKETLLHALTSNKQWDLADFIAMRQPELLVVKDELGQTPFLMLVRACLAGHQRSATIDNWYTYRLRQLSDLPHQSDKTKDAHHAACLKEMLLTANWQHMSPMHCVAGCCNEVASLDILEVLCKLASQTPDGVAQLLTVQDRYKGFPAHHAAAANNCAIMQ